MVTVLRHSIFSGIISQYIVLKKGRERKRRRKSKDYISSRPTTLTQICMRSAIGYLLKKAGCLSTRLTDRGNSAKKSRYLQMQQDNKL